MAQPESSRDGAGSPPAPRRAWRADPLRAWVGRLGALESAWSVLAPCTEPHRAAGVLAAERAAKQRLLGLAKQSGGADPQGLQRLAGEFDRLRLAISDTAFSAPFGVLHAALLEAFARDRQPLLDLLDLLAPEVFDAPEAYPIRLAVVDHLITLLCTECRWHERVAPLDPVTLTPTLQSLCRRAESERAAAAAGDLEGEFFNAANLAADLAQDSLQALAARKARLGRSYFAPGMLRAVVTYNLALLQSRPGDLAGAAHWAGEAGEAAQAAPLEPVFESALLRGLHAALRRRIDREPPRTDPLHRLAWALDLGALTPAETNALRRRELAAADPRPAIVLVGLVCRSLEVIALELQELGVDPDRAAAQWSAELDEAVQRAVNASISGSAGEESAYQRACELSRLRSRHLVPARRGAQRPRDGEARAVHAALAEQRTRREAVARASEALERAPAAPRRGSFWRASWRGLSWRQAAAPLAAALALAMLVFAPPAWLDRDLDGWSRSELAGVSEYLVRGHRNGGGSGPSFVGTIHEDWIALPPSQRERAAVALVGALRERGVRQVMIYDDARTLRIQALGDTLRML